MALKLSLNHLQLIQAHAERTYPEECCGLLLGEVTRQNNQETRLVAEICPTQNAWTAEVETVSLPISGSHTSEGNNLSASEGLSRMRRYWIDPKEILEVQRYARERQLDIIGVYHSHPDYPAVPSECDRALAWSSYSYLIVSVQQGITQDLLCWCLDEQNQFQSEAMLTAIPIEA